jgi:hypothetical protein
MRRIVLLLAAALAASVHAEETTADWIKRILDPATIGVAPFPGSTLNRKITVDTIRYDRDAPPAKRTAVYTVPLAQLADAAHHFEQVLGMKAQSDTDPKGNPRHRFLVSGESGQPARAKGLRVTIERSPWVDGMGQIEMEYLPPG